MSVPPDTNALLQAHAAGDRVGVARLFPAFYDELRRLAHRQLANGVADGDRTLNTTALVHEAFLKLGQRDGLAVENRRHFFALVAQAMRQIIVDDARRHMTGKRGGGAVRLAFDENIVAVDGEAERLVALDRALARLDAIDPRLARVVECRFFAGLSESETAEALDMSLRSVQRHWLRARGWLRQELGSPER
jgi:RNA polymerase sigma factor (TIGR02999 family)